MKFIMKETVTQILQLKSHRTGKDAHKIAFISEGLEPLGVDIYKISYEYHI